jgi:6-phosphogluconate dehydrogenase
MKKADIGLIGLGVMGENLAINIESKGYAVSVFNRTTARVKDFTEGRAAGKRITGAWTLKELAESLERPRKIMIMVRAGEPVDETIEHLLPLLEKGDILIDGGNSHFADTARRMACLGEKGLLYVGTGVSGGEEGALTGPSMMPGGSEAAWPYVKDIFRAISARADDGTPCCEWMGGGGAGHFVKMVHNGIEYGDMQLICEAYHLMRDSLGMTAGEMHEIFLRFNETELKSYLIEITANILAYRDKDGKPLVDKILDAAGQKGTGKWISAAAMDEGVPLTLISEAVFARCLSERKDERVAASRLFAREVTAFTGNRREFVGKIRKALLASKIISYAQGYDLLRAAAAAYGWKLNYGAIAGIWRAGCIIRSVLLDRIKEAFERSPDLANIILDPYFKALIKELLPAWRDVAATAIRHGIPVPAMTSALSYFDGYTAALLPANLLQAQRDYFGGHMYQRLDAKRGKYFHTSWTERGGSTEPGS